MNTSRVFISGVGVVSPNGIGVTDFWNNCKNGVSGVREIDFFDLDGNRTHVAGFIPQQEELPCSYTQDKTLYDRVSLFSKTAADEALSNAMILDMSETAEYRTGIILGVAMGGMSSLEKCYIDFLVEKTGMTFYEILAAMPSSPANLLAIEYGITGPNLTINTACSSATTAIGLAYSMIKSESLDICITGGAEAPITPTTLKHFEKLRLLNSKSNEMPEKACKPFSGDRLGTVLSEGAAILLIESEKSLKSRDHAPIGEIIGFGTGNDACYLVKPKVEGLETAMRCALKDADISPNAVDYIHAHGTATRQNDTVESLAIKRIYGEKAYQIPISSVKSMIGHTLGASGALSTVLTALSMKNEFITPTINLHVPDKDCDLDYTPNTGRSLSFKTAAVQSFGLGGNNSVLIIRHPSL